MHVHRAVERLLGAGLALQARLGRRLGRAAGELDRERSVLYYGLDSLAAVELAHAIETRLARMEAELERMQRLVELKDTQIAALESEAAARKASDVLQAVRATEAADMENTAAAEQQTPAPVSVEREQALPTDAMPARPRAWYEEYLWPIWAALGLMALAALVMLLRRPREHAAEATVAELTGANEPMSPPVFEIRQTAPSMHVEETNQAYQDELDDMVAELDTYYSGNPQQLNRPVLEVLYVEMALPRMKR